MSAIQVIEKYTDAEVDAIVLTHKNIAGAHHAKYLDSEAVTAMGAKGDTNPLHHDKQTGRGFRAIKTSALAVTTDTWTTVIFDTEEFDDENEYNSSDGKYTPQTAGYYIITGNAVFADLLDGNKYMMVLRKNGGVVAVNRGIMGAAGFGGAGPTAIIYLNGTTDYTLFQIFHDKGSNASLATTTGYNAFSGWLLQAP